MGLIALRFDDDARYRSTGAMANYWITPRAEDRHALQKSFHRPSMGLPLSVLAMMPTQFATTWMQPHRIALIVGCLAGACFFAFNLALLHNGHFHEDAYILFTYVENVLNGHGVSYYPGGPPTEGATDFLWMWLLVLLGSTGIDVGIAAVALNSLGVALIVLVFAYDWLKAPLVSGWFRAILAPFLFLWLFSEALEAALGGFSVYLYMALVLLGYVSVSKPQLILFTPYLGIVIALFRPDGVIIGAGFTILGFFIAHARDCLRPYLIGCVIAVVIGVVYFVARYSYFGYLLPLPLYVKSSTEGLVGLHENLSWLKQHRVFLYPLLLLGALYYRQSLRYLTLATPVVLFFAILSVASQTQNVGYRFQGPIFILVYYVLLMLLLEAACRPAHARLKAVLIVIILPFFIGDAQRNYVKAHASITNSNYINTFPLALRNLLPEDYIFALTEAGRLAYWNRSGNEIVDIVGLNNAYVARHPVTVDYLAELSPDIIMYHTDSALVVPAYEAGERPKAMLFAHGQAPHLIQGWSSGDRKLGGSVVALTGYLQCFADQYDIFLVDYQEDGSYLHVYGLKKTLGLRSIMAAALEASFDPSFQLSYMAMKRQQRAN